MSAVNKFVLDNASMTIVNCIVVDTEKPFELPGCTIIDRIEGVDIGWRVVNDEWQPPVEDDQQ